MVLWDKMYYNRINIDNKNYPAEIQKGYSILNSRGLLCAMKRKRWLIDDR